MPDKHRSTTTIWRYLKWAAVLASVLFVFVVGYLLGHRGAPEVAPGTDSAALQNEEEAGKATVWTCSMHPQIRQPKPGLCPICGMDLIPVNESDRDTLGPRQLKLSETARKLAEVQTYPAERRPVTRNVPMVGKVDYDETRLEYITAWVPGRLDRLFVDYTGVPVREGDHMVYLYSPDILTAQQELIEARRTVQKLQASDVDVIRETAQATVQAAREKLRLWGLTQEQIQQIENAGVPSDHITIYAPSSGIVVHKNAVEGMYVQTGTRIYTIADLSRLWVKLDAYESDLKWLRYGQSVTLTTEAYPGETFEGRIAFIDPVLTNTTRTVKVRVNVANDDGRLKPDMFVRAQVHATLASAGRVASAELAGKWVCPMHPSEIADEPGACTICGMPLVSTESLGYSQPQSRPVEPPLVIPASAALLTGRRAVVYVKVPGTDGVFEGREIKLGARAGNAYVVESGLREGELVVTNGNFKIDSAMQILAKPSMMTPADDATEAVVPVAKTVEPPASFKQQLRPVFKAYLQTQTILAKDDLPGAKNAAVELLKALDNVDMTQLSHVTHVAWMKSVKDIRKTAPELRDAKNIESARAVFAQLSETLIGAAKRFGTGLEQPIHVVHCPMAFNNRGADWLQLSDKLENPYYGAAMPRCGEIKETLDNHEE